MSNQYGSLGNGRAWISGESKELLGPVKTDPRRSAPTSTDRNAMLRDTVRIAEEADERAYGISDRLGKQREALEGSSTQVHEMKGFANEASRIMTQMARRAACRKATLYGIIAFLCVCIALTLYRLLTNSGHIMPR